MTERPTLSPRPLFLPVASSVETRPHTVLVAADEIRRRACHLCLSSDPRRRYLVLEAVTGGRVVEIFGEVDVDVLLLSSRLPDVAAPELLGDLQRLRPGQPLSVILLADDYDEPGLQGTVDGGTLDVVPWRDLDRFVLRRAVDLALERAELRRRLHALESELATARRREARLQGLLAGDLGRRRPVAGAAERSGRDDHPTLHFPLAGAAAPAQAFG